MATNVPLETLKDLMEGFKLGLVRVNINGLDMGSIDLGEDDDDDDVEEIPKMEVFRVTFKDSFGEKTKIYTANMPIVKEMGNNKFYWARDLIGDEYTFPIDCKVTIKHEFVED